MFLQSWPNMTERCMCQSWSSRHWVNVVCLHFHFLLLKEEETEFWTLVFQQSSCPHLLSPLASQQTQWLPSPPVPPAGCGQPRMEDPPQAVLRHCNTTRSTPATLVVLSPPRTPTQPAASPPSLVRPPPRRDENPGCFWGSADYGDANVCSWWPPAWCCRWWWSAGSSWTTVLSVTSSPTPTATWSIASPTSTRPSPSHVSRREASATSATCWITRTSVLTRTSSSCSLSKRPQGTLRGVKPSDPPGVMRPTSATPWEWLSGWCLP